MKKRYLIYFITILFISTLLAGAIVTRFDAESNDDSIIVTWETANEEGVNKFNLLRSYSVDGQFSVVHEQKAKGYGFVYKFTDNSVYKNSSVNASFYVYKLEIVLTDGTKAEVAPISVHHDQVSSIKRTWGSIKALFR